MTFSLGLFLSAFHSTHSLPLAVVLYRTDITLGLVSKHVLHVLQTVTGQQQFDAIYSNELTKYLNFDNLAARMHCFNNSSRKILFPFFEIWCQ